MPHPVVIFVCVSWVLWGVDSHHVGWLFVEPCRLGCNGAKKERDSPMGSVIISPIGRRSCIVIRGSLILEGNTHTRTHTQLELRSSTCESRHRCIRLRDTPQVFEVAQLTRYWRWKEKACRTSISASSDARSNLSSAH